LAAAALLALTLTATPAPVGALSLCAPESAGQAHDALVAAAPDGSAIEVQAMRLAGEARKQGTFDTDETATRLDELARGGGYFWDCAPQAYVYDADDAPDPDDEAVIYDEAAEPSRSTPTAPPAPEPTTAAEPERGGSVGSDASTTGSAPKPKAPSSRRGTPEKASSNPEAIAAVGGSATDPVEAATATAAASGSDVAASGQIAVKAEPDRAGRSDGLGRWVLGGAALGGILVAVRRRRRA
jgi:hypothetical protein